MFRKNAAFWGLGLAAAISIILGLLGPTLAFNYDFESFFPSDDPELAFYQDYRNQFENDNDYLLIALGNPSGIFDKVFLNKALQLQHQLAQLEYTDTIISILELEQPLISPFGIRFRKVLDWSNNEVLAQTSKRVRENPLFSENLISREEDYVLLILKNKQQISKEEGDQLYGSVSTLLNNSGIIDYYSAGKIKAQGEFINLLQQEFTFFLGISFILIIIILYIIFRTWWGILLPVVVLGVGIGWAMAFSLLMGHPFDVMSVMQPTILLIIGLSALVHYLTLYLNKLRGGIEKGLAIKETFSELFLAVFLTCLTTALGFTTLFFTSAISLKMFGLFTGIGVMVMFFSVVLLTPGLLYLLPPIQVKDKKVWSMRWENGMRSSLLMTLNNKRPVLFGFLAVSVVSVIMMTQLKVNGYLLDNLPRDHALTEDFAFFDRHFGGSKPLEIYLEAGAGTDNLLELEVLSEIEKLENFVQKKYSTGAIVSPLALVKALNQSRNSGNPNAFRVPSAGQYLQLKPYMAKSVETAGFKIISDDFQRGRISTRTSDMGSYKGSVLKKDLDNFVDAEINGNLLKVQLTGTSNLIDKSHETISFQMAKGLGAAFLIVGLMAGFLFRSWRISLIILIPNVIPLLWMCAVMWILGIELKLTTAIIFTVAFGIAVDDSIHFMTKIHHELGNGKSLLYAIKRTYLETGKAIILTTIILVSGFSLLVLSEFGVTYYAGLLISLALLFALFSDLVLLPVLLLPMQKVWKSKNR